jgi:putative transposase
MTYPLVRDPAAENNPVRLTCGVLGHSTHAYYAWAAAPISQHDLDDAYSTNALIDARGDDPEFGYRFLADEVARAGLIAGERRVRRLCSEQRLWSTTVCKGRRGAGKIPGRIARRPRPAELLRLPPDRLRVSLLTRTRAPYGSLRPASVS